jgi:enamine deaminase RidA (YjgF/YER057c/UK114 family)
VSVLVAQALAGGLPGPQKIDTDWRGVLIDSTAGIAQTMAQIPQDVNPLGVRAALADIVKTNIYVTDIDEFLRRRLEGAWTT